MAKSEEKLRARELRQGGESIKVIAQKLGVAVGSVSVWCRDIQLTSYQLRKLELRMKDPGYGKRDEYLKKIRKLRDDRILLLRKEGIDEVGKLSERERFLIGIALYWGEGFKKDNQVGFSNTDPKMMKCIILWLVKSCNVPISDLKFRICINVNYQDKGHSIQEYWKRELGIANMVFQKPILQNVALKKKYLNPNSYNGVLRIRVAHSLPLLRRIHGYIASISEAD